MEKNEVYLNYVKRKDPKTRVWQTLVMAFLVGGLICTIGEGFRQILILIFGEKSEELIANNVTSIMIFLGALLTGLGVYDDIGKHAGAGSIVPITGFANSVVSPALEFKSEGIVLGLEAKMFLIAGPVIVSGVVASSLVGLIYFFIYL